MSKIFKKLMRKQIQETIDQIAPFSAFPVPKAGWIATIREALGISSQGLANRMGCSQANISSLETREVKKTISLEKLEEAAAALNCKLVYCLVPEKPFDTLLQEQARRVAQKRIRAINHSMSLEQQGLTPKQIKQQEDDLVEELLEGNLKNLWDEQ